MCSGSVRIAIILRIGSGALKVGDIESHHAHRHSPGRALVAMRDAHDAAQRGYARLERIR